MCRLPCRLPCRLGYDRRNMMRAPTIPLLQLFHDLILDIFHGPFGQEKYPWNEFGHMCHMLRLTL